MTNTPIIDEVIKELQEKGIQVDVSHTATKPTRFFKNGSYKLSKIKRNCLGLKIKK